jgi:parallel beta-helix repeat protein
MPIAAVLTVTIILSVSFFVFTSTYLFNQPLAQVPVIPISAGAQSSNTIYTQPSSTIYIRPDGSIDPSTAPIQEAGNVYKLTDNITGNNETAIEVQKNDIIIDGADYTLQGQGATVGGTGIDISNKNNVTIENFLITNFVVGINVENTANIKLFQNNITTYTYENGVDVSNSTNNTISNNNIVSYANIDANQNNGIGMSDSFNNTVSKNNVVGSWIGISLESTNCSIVSGNSVTQSQIGIQLEASDANQVVGNNVFGTVEAISAGVYPDSGTGIDLYYKADYNQIYGNNISNNGNGMDVWLDSSNNTICDNNFEKNQFGQVNLLSESGVSNFWNNGTQGNYWSDYHGQGTYVIDQNNVDYHPLTHPTPLSAILPIVIIAAVAFVVALVVLLLLYRRHQKRQVSEQKQIET